MSGDRGFGQTIPFVDGRDSHRKTPTNNQSSSNERTSVYSHTSYHHLTSEEKDTRMRNMHYSAKQRSKALQSKLAHLIDDQGIHLVEHDASDAASLMMELNPLHFSTAHPTEAILESASALKDKRQMRWHPLVIRFALNLSTSSYRAMRQSGIISSFTCTFVIYCINQSFFSDISCTKHSLPQLQQWMPNCGGGSFHPWAHYCSVFSTTIPEHF